MKVDLCFKSGSIFCGWVYFFEPGLFFCGGCIFVSGSMFRNFYRAHVLEMDFFGGRNLNVARSGRRNPLQQHRREASKECIEE